jgi:membrane-bound lytic murein transglycosylase B
MWNMGNYANITCGNGALAMPQFMPQNYENRTAM